MGTLSLKTSWLAISFFLIESVIAYEGTDYIVVDGPFEPDSTSFEEDQHTPNKRKISDIFSSHSSSEENLPLKKRRLFTENSHKIENENYQFTLPKFIQKLDLATDYLKFQNAGPNDYIDVIDYINEQTYNLNFNKNGFDKFSRNIELLQLLAQPKILKCMSGEQISKLLIFFSNNHYIPQKKWTNACEKSLLKEVKSISTHDIHSTLFAFAQMNHKPSTNWMEKWYENFNTFNIFFDFPSKIQAVAAHAILDLQPNENWVANAISSLETLCITYEENVCNPDLIWPCITYFNKFNPKQFNFTNILHKQFISPIKLSNIDLMANTLLKHLPKSIHLQQNVFLKTAGTFVDFYIKECNLIITVLNDDDFAYDDGQSDYVISAGKTLQKKYYQMLQFNVINAKYNDFHKNGSKAQKKLNKYLNNLSAR